MKNHQDQHSFVLTRPESNSNPPGQVNKADRLAIKQLPDHQINSQSAKLPEKEIESKKIIPANHKAKKSTG
jgi:hypothetical protein